MSARRGKVWWLTGAAAGAILLAVLALLPVGGGDLGLIPGSNLKATPMDMSAFLAAPPDHPLDLLFIHHSVGGQWLADVGPESGADCINAAHPEGGKLRRALEGQGYRVHEASYGSRMGQDTDLFDWLPKFRDHMPEVLACALQDASLTPPAQNHIVLFKSCYPNNAFEGSGAVPGNPRGPALTLANAQAAYAALLPEFARQPGVLFVCVTTPPLAPVLPPEPLWKAVARKLLGKPERRSVLLNRALLSRQFANWLTAGDGWLKDYPQPNVVAFDYYDVLTGMGASDLLKYPTDGGTNSHPSAAGQARATEALIPLLNRAVRRAGLSR